MQEIVHRDEAIEKGLPRYFTGKPCKHGHVAARNTASCVCLKCNGQNARDARQKFNKSKIARLMGKTPMTYMVYPAVVEEVEKAIRALNLSYEILLPAPLPPWGV